MKRIFIHGLAAAFALAGAAALAQDLTAGKTAAQLFSSDCSACHRSPAGLATNRDARALAGFLREHYTTKPDTAGALAAYVGAFAGSAPADARPGAAPGTPAAAANGDRPAGVGERRARREPEISPTGEAAHTAARPAEDRRRRSPELSGEGEKPSARRPAEGAAAPRPGSSAATQATAAAEGEVAPREALDPLSRLRAYASSGLDSEGVAAEAAKTRSGPVPQRKENPAPAAPTQAAPVAANMPVPAAAPTGADAPRPLRQEPR
jgi:hypothetical protein